MVAWSLAERILKVQFAEEFDQTRLDIVLADADSTPAASTII